MPTPKQAKLAETVVENPTLPFADACRAAGYAETIALHQARRTIHQRGVQDEIKRLMKGAKVSDTRVFRKLSALLDAENTVGVNVLGGEKGERERVQVPDHTTQLKTAELFLKMRGFLRDEKDLRAVFVLMVQQVAPLFLKRIPVHERPGLRAELRELLTTDGNHEITA